MHVCGYDQQSFLWVWQSFVLHRCMRTYILACLLLVIQETRFSIKFAFPWRPDQAGTGLPRGTDGQRDEPFRRPMHKDTCTHMHLRTTNPQVYIYIYIDIYVLAYIIRLFRRCGSQGQSGFRHFQMFSVIVLALPWLFSPQHQELSRHPNLPMPRVRSHSTYGHPVLRHIVLMVLAATCLHYIPRAMAPHYMFTNQVLPARAM